jgi:hypothetical protein
MRKTAVNLTGENWRGGWERRKSEGAQEAESTLKTRKGSS